MRKSLLFSGFSPAAIALLLLSASGVAAPVVELSDCRISAGPGSPSLAARCGVLTRPLDPSDAASEPIDLSVAIVPALSLNPAPDPLVVIAGGPGQSSISFYAAYARAFEGIRRERDIVLMDQRGTGQSAPLTCDSPADAIVEGRMSQEQVVAEVQRCLEQLPYDARFFTTSAAVSDLSALGEALGYPSFNLYGISYGTRVAQHFLRRYPQQTRAVILDGVAPPQLALGPDIAIAAQDALEAAFAECENQPACKEQFPALRNEFLFLRGELQTNPVDVQLLHPLTAEPTTVSFGGDELAGVIRLLSYHPSSIALLPLLIHSAASGNLIPMASQYQMTAVSVAASMSLGMHNSVICTEDVPFYATTDINEDELVATYIGLKQLELLRAICDVWPAGIIDEDLKSELSSDKPVLLLSGSADPVTPPRYAEQAAKQLSNSLHVIGNRQGHGLAIRGCTPDIIADFIKAESVADLDTKCLERAHVMPFFLNFDGPGP